MPEGPFGRPPVEVGPVIEEEAEPTRNLVEALDRLYYLGRAVTHESRFARTEENPEGRERPPFLRARRAELHAELEDADRGERGEILRRGHLWDQIAEQTLNQREVVVNLPEIGEARARMVELMPPESLRTPETLGRPPIILIPGIANDIESVGNLLGQMAFEGRRVIGLGYPDSIMGKVNPEFVEAVKNHPDFTAHVKFFEAVIDEVAKEGPLEIWGLSTGVPVVAEILNDPKYQQRTRDAVLMCPAAVVDQSLASIAAGTLQDTMHFRAIQNLIKWELITGAKAGKDKAQEKLRMEAVMAAVEKIRRPDPAWKTARVEGGKIVVVSCGEDKITKSASMEGDFEKENPSMRLLRIPDGYHMTPNIEPERVLPQIFALQR